MGVDLKEIDAKLDLLDLGSIALPPRKYTGRASG